MSFDVAKMAVEAAVKAGADYADARPAPMNRVADRPQPGDGGHRPHDSIGVGVRVLAGGRWGFAATSRQDPEESCAPRRSPSRSRKRGVAPAPVDPVTLSPVEPVVATWRGPMEEDPFTVPLEEKVALLMEAHATDAVRARRHVRRAGPRPLSPLHLVRVDRRRGDRSGGGALRRRHRGDGGRRRRHAAPVSYPNSFRGHVKAAGYEHIRTLGLDRGGRAHRAGGRRAASAPGLPERGHDAGARLAGQIELQVHESIGHPIELDRVLGMEEAYAGSSCLKPDDRGTAAVRQPARLGHRGRDAAGRARHVRLRRRGRARSARTPILVDGIFQNFLTSRETAPVVGQASNGTSRADGWSHLPLIRMTNISLEPREGSLAEIIGDTEGRHLHGHEPARGRSTTSASTSSSAARSRGASRTASSRRWYKNPNYTGITPEFWGSCDAIGGREEWTVWGTPNCGKGQPGQVGRVGHGTSPARFRDVQVGVR